ncbi:hypothetical protein AVEN_206380-1, partial [Araneus ventricosus]
CTPLALPVGDVRAFAPCWTKWFAQLSLLSGCISRASDAAVPSFISLSVAAIIRKSSAKVWIAVLAG